MKQGNLDVELEFFQTNFEGEIIDKIQESVGSDYEGIIINPGAFSHTSIAIADAIMLAGKPVIEVHLTNIQAREIIQEKFLHRSGLWRRDHGIWAAWLQHGFNGDGQYFSRDESVPRSPKKQP